MNAASPVLYVCMFAYLTELGLYRLAPGVLARLAFLPVALVRRVPVALAQRQGNTICEGETQLDGSVLMKSGASWFALRPAFRWNNNRPFLVNVTYKQEGHETVLRAKQALFPIGVPTFAFGLAWSSGPAYGFAPLEAAAMFSGVTLVATLLLGWLRARTDRDHAIAQAFDAIEKDLRRIDGSREELREGTG